MRRLKIIIPIGALLIAVVLVLPRIGAFRLLMAKLHGEKTVEDRLKQYGPTARSRLEEYFAAKGVKYPPKKIVFLVLKEERVLQLYAEGAKGRMVRVKDYPILAASGGPGPKLRYGDCQVSEGIYRVEWLNPNSLYHLSMRLDYPNEFDREMAKADGRTNLGGDIMIHGSNVSVGCVAVGDKASEDLFVLASDAGRQQVGHSLLRHPAGQIDCGRRRGRGTTGAGCLSVGAARARGLDLLGRARRRRRRLGTYLRARRRPGGDT